jgi:hypothetical protein
MAVLRDVIAHHHIRSLSTNDSRRTRIRALGTMNAVSTTAVEWLKAYAQQLGIDAPDEEECDHILALAGTAAHASERTAAPVACWLAAKAGLDAAQANGLALQMVVPNSPPEPEST